MIRLFIYSLVYLIHSLEVSGLCSAVCPDGKPLCDYNGSISVTSGGRSCQKWTDQSPHSHFMELSTDKQILEDAGNYCRTFGSSMYEYFPACLTTDPKLRTQGCGETICGGSPCGGIISNAVGMLTLNDSDGLWRYGPFSDYSFPIDCLWTLTAPQDMLIELDITQFHAKLRAFPFPCVIVSLEVYETKESYFSHGNFCSHNGSGSHMRSKANTLYVHFRYTSVFSYQVWFAAKFSHVKKPILHVCNQDEFACTDGSCIPREYRCDGTFADCGGAEDEEDCDLVTKSMVKSTEVSTTSGGNSLLLRTFWLILLSYHG